MEDICIIKYLIWFTDDMINTYQEIPFFYKVARNRFEWIQFKEDI